MNIVAGPNSPGNYVQPNTATYVPPASVGTVGLYSPTTAALIITGPTWPGNYRQPS